MTILESAWLAPMPALLLRETPSDFQSLRTVKEELEQILGDESADISSRKSAELAHKLVEFIEEYKRLRNQYSMQLKNEPRIDRTPFANLAASLGRYSSSQAILAGISTVQNNDLRIIHALRNLQCICMADTLVDGNEEKYKEIKQLWDFLLLDSAIRQKALDNVSRIVIEANYLSFLILLDPNAASDFYKSEREKFAPLLEAPVTEDVSKNAVISGVANTLANFFRKSRTGVDAHDKKERFEHALPFYRKAKEVNPNTNVVTNNLAICLSKIGGEKNLEEAIAFFDEVITRDKNKRLLVAPLYKARALIQLGIVTQNADYGTQAIALLDEHVAHAIANGQYSDDYKNYALTRMFKAKAEAEIIVLRYSQPKSEAITSKTVLSSYKNAVTSFTLLENVSKKRVSKMQGLQREVDSVTDVADRNDFDQTTAKLAAVKPRS